MVQYIANSLLEVFQMDLSYFRQVAPVTDDILSIVIAVGWALLLGNLVFQAMKSMVIGLGFEGEDPKLLFTRTFVFAFLLLVSQQICEIGLGISSQVIALLQVPTSVTITIPDENNFTIGASWLLIIIVGIVVMWQFVKLCFEVAERYVVTAILVLMAPLAFGMGGSKNTEDIFKGWCRMFGSMCVMMIMNVIFLKLLISALGYVPSGVAVLPWMLLIVGIARVARKIDGIIARMGLNPALTGDGLGRGLPGMVAYAVVKGIGSSIAKAAGNSVGNKSRKGGSSGGSSSEPRTNPRTPPPPPSGGSPGGAGASPGAASAGQQAGTQTDPRSPSAQGGVYASKQTVQGVSPKMDEAPPEGSHAAGVEQPAAEHKGGKTPTIHTHGARRSSVPPEARGTRASTPYTNGNFAAFGNSGAGKSTLLQSIGKRLREQQRKVIYIVPEKGHEYRPLCEAVGGQFIKLGPSSPDCIGLMDIRRLKASPYAAQNGGTQRRESLLAEKVSWLSVWYSLQKRNLSEEDMNYIDASLIECYGRRGITFDNASLFEEDGVTIKEMPVIQEWYDILREKQETKHLSVILTRYVSGSAASMGGHTNVDTENPYIVIDLTDIPDDLQLATVYAATGFATDITVQNGDVGTALLSDELWKLLGANSNPLAADYTMRMVKLIRSQGGVAGVTSQGMADMMALDGGKYGKGILDSCRIKFIMQMEDQEARLVQNILNLTEEETKMITRFRRGEGLLCIGHNHVPIAVHVSPREYEAITTSPTDLRARQQARVE